VNGARWLSTHSDSNTAQQTPQSKHRRANTAEQPGHSLSEAFIVEEAKVEEAKNEAKIVRFKIAQRVPAAFTS
jgi:hypothetical protein